MAGFDVVSFSLDAAGCGLGAPGSANVAKAAANHFVADVGGFAGGAEIAADCWLPQFESELSRQLVGAIDPNDIVGPSGTGAQRFIDGDAPLAYQVLFENLSSRRRGGTLVRGGRRRTGR